MALVTTLSSLGTSAGINLNTVPKATTFQLTVASGSSGSNIYIQYTLDDRTIPGSGSATWAPLSSAIISSNADGVGVMYTVLSPLAGVRLSSTTTVTGTITLKALQAVTA